MILHRLDGCSPTPLACYLKALGVLRLISEQLDPAARGWWEGDRFFLASDIDQEELIAFFLERYEPTPLVAPWNKGSGFYYPGDIGLAPVENSCAPRFARLREGIAAARAELDAVVAIDRRIRDIKTESKDRSLTSSQRAALRNSDGYKKRLAAAEAEFKQRKADLIPSLRLSWRGPLREWMDAALVLTEDNTARFPALLGTGGNDGRLDFSNNFFQRLNELFDCSDTAGRPRRSTRRWFQESLFGGPAQVLRNGLPVGQFAPGLAGGANMSSGPDGDSGLNPVDFVLMLEGTLLFASAATRRFESPPTTRASAPFAVFGRAAGYSSAANSDESARGEQWMPLWINPVTVEELKRLFAESRAQIGARNATEPLDLARAVARLGTSRGIRAFQRFGYIERNGQSNLAVPLGRYMVPEHSSPRLACLDDLEGWLRRLRRQARAEGASGRFVRAERRLSDAIFAVTQRPDDRRCWQFLLMRMADIEAVQITGSGFEAGPIPRLRPEWVEAVDDGSAEVRLAIAFSLQRGESREGSRLTSDGVRRHWLSLDDGRFATTGSSGKRLVSREDRVLQGRRGVDDAVALVHRRMVEGSQRGKRHLPLSAARDAFAYPTDLAHLIAGHIDLDRTMRLARALMAIDAASRRHRQVPREPPASRAMPDDGWIAIRLALLPWPLRSGDQIRIDPAILRRLESGDATDAVRLALRRLRAAGIRPSISVARTSRERARLWAAALAFPITHKTAANFAKRLDPTSLEETAA